MTRPALATAMASVGMMCAVLATDARQEPARPLPPTTLPGQATPPQGRGTNLGTDPNGNPIRLALKTGHVSNYDESKVAPYTLPDPLVLASGKPVRDKQTWTKQRRPELVRLFESEIYGSVPANAPKVHWAVTATDPNARDGAAVTKTIVGTIGDGSDAPKITLSLTIPAAAKGPVPIILTINFGGGRTPPPGGAGRGPGAGTGEPPVAAEILQRGWGYGVVKYADIQADRANSWNDGVIGLTFKPGQTEPAPGEWGTIAAWSWGLSRIVDYLETDKSVDAKQIALQGHSRLGKTVLWASAQDERIAAVFSSCAGEMGSSLWRRDWGETVDDMAQNFAWQFAGNFQKYSGHWNDLPVDAHTLIALSAPRPVFITGGTQDQWADPVGEYLATVAAGPVYSLLGRKPLDSTAKTPPLDTPLTSGDLGFHYHTGGHMATPADWNAFLAFLGKYFK